MRRHILGNVSLPVPSVSVSVSAPVPGPTNPQVSYISNPSQRSHTTVIVNDPNHVMPKARRLIISAIHKSSNVPGANCIHLRQIEVYDKHGTNWASLNRGGIAHQSSNHWNDKNCADNLIDENYTTINHTSSKDKTATVTITLSHEIEVSMIKVVNMKNSQQYPHGDRLEGTLMKLEDEAGNQTSAHYFSRVSEPELFDYSIKG